MRERVKEKQNKSDFSVKFRLIPYFIYYIRRDSFEIALVENSTNTRIHFSTWFLFIRHTSLSLSPAHTLKLDKRRGDCTDDDPAPRLGLDERERERETFFTLVREKVVKKYKPAKRREINGLPPSPLWSTLRPLKSSAITSPRVIEIARFGQVWNVHGSVL